MEQQKQNEEKASLWGCDREWGDHGQSTGDEYQPPEKKTRKKPESVTLTLPTKNIANAGSLSTSQNYLSQRGQMAYLADIITAGGANPLQFSLSPKEGLKMRLWKNSQWGQSYFQKYFGWQEIHSPFRWKAAAEITGHVKTTNQRIAVTVSSPDLDTLQLLRVPAVPSSKWNWSNGRDHAIGSRRRGGGGGETHWCSIWLSVLHNPAARSVRLWQDYVNSSHDESLWQDLIMAVSEHRRRLPTQCTKLDLSNM